MTRVPAASLGRPAAIAVASLLAVMGVASAARAAGPAMQFATARPDLPMLPPSQNPSSASADGTPLYERAPMPNQNAFEPQYDSGSSDPLQPSVISRGGKVAESGGFSRNSSANATQESRMKPGLGFALHVPTE